ncbi:MAG: redoxin domain-containing protein [Phaeodactylibacter sp.]|nr:redoxin domain-containing protein [Phaeodactylibacter sp.]
MKHLLIAFFALTVIACNAPSSQGASHSNNGTGNTNNNVVTTPKAVRDNSPAESPDITLTLSGIQGGVQASLIGHLNERRFRADSTIVGQNGTIHFKREEPYLPGFYYILIPQQAVVQLLIDKDQTMQLQANAGDEIGSMQVTGNLNNEILYKNLQFEQSQSPKFDAISGQLKGAQKGTADYDRLTAERSALIQERKSHLQALFNEHPNTLFTSYKRAGQNPDLRAPKNPDGSLDTEAQVYYFRQDFWNGVDFTDERLLRTPVIFNKLNRYITELTAQNPDSLRAATKYLMDKVVDQADTKEFLKFFANWITLKYEPTKTTLMDAEAMYVFMVQNYFTRERAFWSDSMNIYGLQQRAEEMAGSLVGKQAPNVTSFAPDGSEKTLLDLKAPYLIVYMYNPTCEHCMEQTPKLVNFYRTWKSKGVDVYGIALDTDQQEWTNYIQKTGMNWTNVFDPSSRSIYGKYYVDVTPEIYVIGPDRKIIAKNIKVNQIEEVIRMDKEKR